MIEHETNEECWCQPYPAGDDVWVHRTDVGYLEFELELIGDICVDYDGAREIKGLMSLIDEIKERSYGAAKRAKEMRDDAD